MSGVEQILLANGKIWAVGSMIASNSDVVVPTDQLLGMTAAEIGQAVIDLVKPAEAFYEAEIAEMEGRRAKRGLR